MIIRKTAAADLDAVMEIYAYARAAMKESGNPDQWGDAHPPRAMIEADIEKGLSYVCENNRDNTIAAVFYFEIAPDPTYAKIDGKWLNDAAPYGVVHRIARGKEAKGAGAFCLEWCYAQCQNLRIDTHEANTPMIKLMERLGYRYCGIIRLGLFDDPKLDERRAFQKCSTVLQMKALSARLQEASRAYYHENRELISDHEYDALYDELMHLEAESGTILAGSPTQKVGYEVVGALQKVAHAVPMLSLDKTKEPNALVDFLGEHTGLLTWKLDGLAISLTYENGTLKQALTRGNGTVGEDVTHNARVFANLPLTLAYKESFTVRGEAVIPFADFAAVNASLPAEEAYKNPRNLCSGTVRQLNSEVAAKRRVRFYAIGCDLPRDKKSAQLQLLADLGFETVAHQSVTASDVIETVENFKIQIADAPVATDGLVLTFDDIAYGASLGATSKFPRDSVAFKWADEEQETTLLEIEWNTSRTGLINPVAVFAPVELEGTSVSRAGLHNVSILRELALNIGDRITVYKANMIIPQVARNLSAESPSPRSDLVEIPAFCPVCGGLTEIVYGPSGAALYCVGTNCSAQRLRALSHFVSRDALNIEGLSEQTLEKLLALDLIKNYPDIFNLTRHEETIVQMEGFGQKSYANLIAAIEKSKETALPNFIYALGIRHVGLANAKLLCAHFAHDPLKIKAACASGDYMEALGEIKGFGEAIAQSLHQYFTDEENITLFEECLPLLRIQAPADAPAAQPLTGLTFVITGDVQKYKNRKALQAFIESLGGKVTGSVTAKTSYLINNDAASASGKNKKAAELGVPVLTEEGLENLLEELTP
jgi:DNA ligase (NAD+)